MSEKELTFADWTHERVSHFEVYAEAHLPSLKDRPKTLVAAMRYAVLGGGKRIRALLCYAAGEITEAKAEVLDAAALALECIHGYSLVHDDMPAMDNDTLRRGKPTVHVEFGEATALLAGDALQCQAFESLSTLSGDPLIGFRLMQTLSRASGTQGMCGGQALDLAMVGTKPGEAELLTMQAMKTGALIRAAVLLGAQSGHWEALSAVARQALITYADAIGLAFQIVDDILDVTADSKTLGKTPGKDEKEDKPTWVSLYGLEGAQKRAQTLLDEALGALETIRFEQGLPFSALQRLREIAHYVIDRNH